MDKRLFMAVAKDHYSFRWHMTAILGATVLTAFVIDSCLYWAGLLDMPARYAVTTLLSYLGFLLWMKVWTWFIVSPPVSGDVSVDPGDIADLLDCVSKYTYSSRPVTIHRSFLENAASSIGQIDVPAKDVVDAGGSALDVAGSVGDVASSADEGIVIVIPIIIIGTLLAVILGIGSSLVVEAPVILGETLFECCLGAGLFVGARKWNRKRSLNKAIEKAAEASAEAGRSETVSASQASWLWTAVGLTMKPFVLAAFLALFIGLTAEAYYPGATCMTEAINGYHEQKAGLSKPGKTGKKSAQTPAEAYPLQKRFYGEVADRNAQ